MKKCLHCIQRVALIRTLVMRPDIILLDEPFSALDYQTRLSVSNDVYNIIKREGKTAIMVTHDLGEALSLSDRIIILSRRPAVVKKEEIIKYNTGNNPIEKRKAKEFAVYYEELGKDLDLFV